VSSERPTDRSVHRGQTFLESLHDGLICSTTPFPVISTRTIGVLPFGSITDPFIFTINPSGLCPYFHRILKYSFELMRIADSDTCSIEWSRCTSMSSIANLKDFEANIHGEKQGLSSKAVSAIRAEFILLIDSISLMMFSFLRTAILTYLTVHLSLHKVYYPETSFTQTYDGFVILVEGSHHGARCKQLSLCDK
jgi:hypothetical protein